MIYSINISSYLGCALTSNLAFWSGTNRIAWPALSPFPRWVSTLCVLVAVMVMVMMMAMLLLQLVFNWPVATGVPLADSGYIMIVYSQPMVKRVFTISRLWMPNFRCREVSNNAVQWNSYNRLCLVVVNNFVFAFAAIIVVITGVS